MPRAPGTLETEFNRGASDRDSLQRVSGEAIRVFTPECRRSDGVLDRKYD